MDSFPNINMVVKIILLSMKSPAATTYSNHHIWRRVMKIGITIVVFLTSIMSFQSHADEVLQFLGQSVGVDMDEVLTVGQIEELGVNPDEYACFQMPMLDPSSGDQIGMGTDCLIFNAIPGRVVSAKGLQNGKAFEKLAGDVAVAALSIFSFENGDVVVTSGTTSVRPLLEGFGDGGTPKRTHITGSIPTPGGNGYLLSTGTREGRNGNARVSGSLTVGDGIFFDCLWIHES